MHITPFTRRCICDTPPASAGGHTQKCNDKYRTEHEAAKDEILAAFYSGRNRPV